MNYRADHIETVKQLAAMRLASLDTSHRARVALLEEQLDQASDGRIKRMKEGQIDAAERDFERRSTELGRVAEQAEIVAEAAVLGALVVQEA